MRKWLLGYCFMLCINADAQKKDFTLYKLLQLTQVPQTEIVSRLNRQGFIAEEEGNSSFNFYKPAKKSELSKSLSINYKRDSIKLVFNTCSAEEFNALNRELQEEGFYFAKAQSKATDAYSLYQKGNFCVMPCIKKEAARTLYSFAIEHKLLPQPQQIRFVEDLLKLPSHEYLAATFGQNQIKKDQFYFSENEVSKCSVLFSHTARQVIIVWKDEVNYRYPALLIVGGSTRGLDAQAAHFKTASVSAWQSAAGVYTGMPLKELEQLNGGAVRFYGWDTDEPGVALQSQKGKLNFKKFGVQLQCLDCNEDGFYSDNGILSSDVLLRQNRRAYVTTLVMKP